MKSAAIIFPHQLFHCLSIFENCTKIYLLEEHLFFKEFKFHKMKLAFHRASMKAYEDFCLERDIVLVYIESSDQNSDVRELIHQLASIGIEEIQLYDPVDNWLEKRIKSSADKADIKINWHDSPLFLNGREELKPFFREDKKSFHQTTFYKKEREKRKVLLDKKNKPKGGKWTYDTENRKKYPKDKTPPAIHFPENTSYWEEAISYVEKHFGENPGELSKEQVYPINREQSIEWLEQFLNYRFYDFGSYEDALVKDESYLHHSLLSPIINVGFLSPQEVLDKSLSFAERNDIPINSTEGFVRQIMGWREFIRGMYECKGSYSRTQNFWNHKRKIPRSFYDGTTGIPPVDDCIKKCLKRAYNHHIERLMVLGNFMLLCEFDPNEVYRWFMEMYIDAYDWVMVPNVYGMSQFADGGTFATKPYISSSNYILKMSNYQSGEWQKYWDGLFWNFMDKNRSFFEGNPRLGMLLGNWDKMDGDKKKTHLENAAQFLKGLD